MKNIQELITIMKKNNLRLLDVTFENEHYRMEIQDRKNIKKKTKLNEGQIMEDIIVIKSPMVGIANRRSYRTKTPDGKSFIETNDFVHKGEVLCMIKAMKTMNEITAQNDCEIVEICFTDGQAVELGQPLFKVRFRGEQC